MAITFNDDQTAALLAALGLPDDTVDVDSILASVTDLASGEGDMGKPSAVAAAAKRHRFEVIEGRQFKADVERQDVETKVDDAIRKGKIAASRRKHWVSLIGADPGMAEVLASVPDETAVNLTEIGHGVANEGELAESAEWFR